MKLTVNSKETEVKDGCTVAELSTFLTLPEKGIAIAVNNRMVPRIEWEKCVLHPNDSPVSYTHLASFPDGSCLLGLGVN